jgi:fibronectin type 3 domain-containing protein
VEARLAIGKTEGIAIRYKIALRLALIALPALYGPGRGCGTAKVSSRVPISSPSSHSVTLRWDASASAGVIGYNIYRSETSYGPYRKLNSTFVTGTSYKDVFVSAGETYYYGITAVGRGNSERRRAQQPLNGTVNPQVPTATPDSTGALIPR